MDALAFSLYSLVVIVYIVENEKMSGLTREGTAEPASRNQILRRERERVKIVFPIQPTTSRVGNHTR